jgi:hypothetical protein
MKPKEADEFGTEPRYDKGGHAYIVSKQGNVKYLSGIGQPTKEPTGTNLARLIAERDDLPANSPSRAIYDAAIKKETERSPGVTVNYGTTAQTGVDPKGNPVFFQTSPQGGAPSIVQGVRPKTEVTGDNAVDKRQYREQRTKLQNAMDVVTAFNQTLANIPKEESLIGAKAGELASSYKLALGAIRELQNTGVLNPGELPFIEDTLRNPQSLSQLINPQSRNEILGQIKAITSSLQSRAKNLDESYGFDIRELKTPEKAGGTRSQW